MRGWYSAWCMNCANERGPCLSILRDQSDSLGIVVFVSTPTLNVQRLTFNIQ